MTAANAHAAALGLPPVETLADALAVLHVHGGESPEDMFKRFQRIVVNYSRKRYARKKPTEAQLDDLVALAHFHVNEQRRYVAPAIRAAHLRKLNLERRAAGK